MKYVNCASAQCTTLLRLPNQQGLFTCVNVISIFHKKGPLSTTNILTWGFPTYKCVKQLTFENLSSIEVARIIYWKKKHSCCTNLPAWWCLRKTSSLKVLIRFKYLSEKLMRFLTKYNCIGISFKRDYQTSNSYFGQDRSVWEASDFCYGYSH